MGKTGRKVVLLALSAVMCLLALAACAGNGTLGDDIDPDTGAIIVTANDAGKGSAVGSLSGGFEIEQGELLVVSPDLYKGSLQVRLLDGAGEIVLNEQVSGHELSTYELEPADYSFGVTCSEDGTTGTAMIVAVDASEFEKQNRDIYAALEAVADSASEETGKATAD